ASLGRISSKLTIDEYKAICCVFLGRSGRNITASIFGINLTVFEYRSGPSKYKIGRSFYVAVLVILPAIFPMWIKRILKSQKTAIFEHHLITIYPNCHCLPHRTGGILESDVLGGKAIAINKETRRARGAYVFSKPILL